MPHLWQRKTFKKCWLIFLWPHEKAWFFCNSPSIFAYRVISSATTNKDLQDIQVKFANFMPYPFKQAVVSAGVTSCWQILSENHFCWELVYFWGGIIHSRVSALSWRLRSSHTEQLSFPLLFHPRSRLTCEEVVAAMVEVVLHPGFAILNILRTYRE